MKNVIYLAFCAGLMGCGVSKTELSLSTPVVNKSGQVAVLDETYTPQTAKKTVAETKTDAFIKAASSMVYVPPSEEKTKPVTESEAIKIDSAPRTTVNREILPREELPVLSSKTAVREIPPPSLPAPRVVKAKVETETVVPTITPVVETGINPAQPQITTGVSKFFIK